MRYINKDSKVLTVIKWLPDAGLGIKGKYLLKSNKGITCQLSEKELKERGYKRINHSISPDLRGWQLC